MKIIYDFLIGLISTAFNFFSLFSKPLQEWNNMRKFHFLSLNTIKSEAQNRQIIFMHCASLGEYEQGLPLVKALRIQYPNAFFLLSFFSPSGYNPKKNTKEFDKVIYLPFDTNSNMRQLAFIIKPDIFIGVKYEFWLNLIHHLKLKGTKIYYISVLLNEKSFLFKWYGRMHLNMLKKIDYFFTQDVNTEILLNKNGIMNTSTIGDTRALSVVQKKDSLINFEDINKWKYKPLIVYASVYPSDADIFSFCEDENFNHIIVPHKVDAFSVKEVVNCINSQYSLYTSKQLDSNIIILDTIGMLFHIYQYADFIYVGGGFEKNIHNTLEPAVFYKPIAFGPKHKSFLEANYFIENGLAKEVNSKQDFMAFLKHYSSSNADLKPSYISFFNANKDSVNKIMNVISFL